MTRRLPGPSLVWWFVTVASAWTVLIAGALAWSLSNNSKIIEDLAAVARRSSDPRDAAYRDPSVLGLPMERTEFAVHASVWILGLFVLGAAALFLWTRQRERAQMAAERGQADEALQRSNERLQAVQSIGRMGYLDWNLATNEIVLSREASEIYRLDRTPTPDELMGFVHPDDKARVETAMRAAVSGAARLDLEHRAICQDGTQIYVRATAELFRDDDGTPIRLLGTIRDIADRKQAEEALRKSLHEKEALLKEVHHRVKNNLQVVTSLLRLEARRNAQPDTRAVLIDMQGRIRAMALLHESLYRSGTFAAVDLGPYVQQVTTQLFRALTPRPGAIRLDVDLASVKVVMDQAIPCGLLVNELVSNCFKHGFPDGRTGEVKVELQSIDGGPQVRLRVSDTGVGLPDDFEAKRKNALGLQLVSDLARQLGGQLQIGPRPAAVFAVTFTATERRPAPV